MHFRFTLAFLAALALTCPLFSQQSGTFSATLPPNGPAVSKGTMRMSPRMYPGPVVTGAPYSAQRVSEHVQVGADGTRFTSSNQQETTYRDAQGRTRTERSMMMG